MAEHAPLTWDEAGKKLYETGTKKGVLYKQTADGKYPKGVAWNGLTGVTESPSGAEETALYADDDKYLSLRSKETFGATVTAYTYPDEFAECDGSAALADGGLMLGQQARTSFGMSYTTTVGNDTELDNHGYKIHILYGCSASPSEKSYSTINDSPEAVEFSWEISTVPVPVKTKKADGTSYNNVASMTIDSTKFKDTTKKGYLENLEKILYGSTLADARLPLPDEVISILTTGTYTES